MSTPAKRLKPNNLTQELSAKWDEAETTLDAIEAGAEKSNESKETLKRLRGIPMSSDRLSPHLWPFIEFLEKMQIYNTHDVHPKLKLRSGPEGDCESVIVDLALVAKDPARYYDIRIAWGLKTEYALMRGICSYYQEWDKNRCPPEAHTVSYVYFEEKPHKGVCAGFEIDGVTVLWPGQEEYAFGLGP
jgi:hypothetical protein